MLEKASWRFVLPLVAGVLGAGLYIASPVSHQAFCSPSFVPVLVAPEGPPAVEAP